MDARALGGAFALVGLVAVGGCQVEVEGELSVGGALEALESPTRDARLSVLYWQGVQRQAPERWAEAAARCEGREVRRYPNCADVQLLAAGGWNFRGGYALDTARVP